MEQLQAFKIKVWMAWNCFRHSRTCKSSFLIIWIRFHFVSENNFSEICNFCSFRDFFIIICSVLRPSEKFPCHQETNCTLVLYCRPGYFMTLNINVIENFFANLILVFNKLKILIFWIKKTSSGFILTLIL